MLKELLFTVRVHHLENGHLERLGKDDESAVIKLSIGNEHLSLEGKLSIDGSCLLLYSLLVLNDNLSTKIQSDLEVAISLYLEASRGSVLAKADLHEFVRGGQDQVDGSVLTIFLLEGRNCHADSGGGEELLHDRKAGVNGEEIS